ncbi:MAG: SGNH/GDSL hydrolase family protein [Christensenellales bacterium]|jgi:lysophospholipase L1-like esterase
MKILCLGDSLTSGSVGHTYVRFLDSRIDAINKGKNGDTIRGAYRRLKRYLRNPKYSSISTYVVWIGVNDLLGPYLSTLSLLWKLLMKPRCAYKHCLGEDAPFAAAYEKVLDLLERNGKKAILVGMPLVQIAGFPPKRILARNAVIKNLAKSRGLPYVDAYSIQRGAQRHPKEAYSWGKFWHKRALDAAVMMLLPRTKDGFARRRHLSLTVDGIHLNSRSARLLAAEISRQVLLLSEETQRGRGV